MLMDLVTRIQQQLQHFMSHQKIPQQQQQQQQPTNTKSTLQIWRKSKMVRRKTTVTEA